MTIDKELRSLLDKHFSDYSIAPMSGGATGAKLYRVRTNGDESYIVKCQKLSLEADYIIYNWLANKVPVPRILFYYKLGHRDLLCMTELKGHPLDYYTNRIENPEIVRRYARSLRMLHSLNITNDAPAQDLDQRLSAAENNLVNELIDRSQLQSEYQHYDLRELFNKLVSIKPGEPELVFTHGDYCLDNLIYDNEVLSGFIDLGNGGVADKYQDIALAVRNIKDNFGDQLVSVFYAEYGLAEVNSSKLEFYTMLDEFF